MFLDRAEFPGNEEYPFSVFSERTEWKIRSRVALLCGENGAGKSTLVNLVSQKYRCHTVGDGRERFPETVLRRVKTVKSEIPSHCFRFSAEEFVNYIAGQERAVREALAEMRRIDEEGKFVGAAKALAKMPHARTVAEVENMYDRPLARCSHGEGFLEFFQSRAADGGLYFLDEPESALSFRNQYRLAYFIRERAKAGCQFVIATHSPVLLLLPDAEIFEVGGGKLVSRTFEELEDVDFLRTFLSRRGAKTFD